MKTILVTGGCGFIGSNFIRMTIANRPEIEIVNLDKLSYSGNISNLTDIKSNKYTMVRGDICDAQLLEKIFSRYEFDMVVHFAAESHVDRSIDHAMVFIETNIIGTLNLLETSKNYFFKGKKKNFKFLHISTDEVYGSLRNTGRFSESTPYDPSSPYSASKASSDHLVRAWFKTYGLPTIITNCSNNYGPYQFPEKLIPLMIINGIENKPLPIYGKGNNIRDWLFVDDHCDAIWSVLENGKIGETYNIGGNNEMKNIDTVKAICKILDEAIPKDNNSSYDDLITFVTDRPGHDFRYAVDTKKIKNDLGWSPKESFESGIKKTVYWYINNNQWWRKIKDSNYNQKRLGLM